MGSLTTFIALRAGRLRCSEPRTLKYMKCRTVAPTEIVSHMHECALILASAPKVYFAAVEGNLPSQMIHDADLQAECAVMQQRASHQPSIDVHLLADGEGQAPSPMQYLSISDMIQDYMNGCPSEHAYHVDNIIRPLYYRSAPHKATVSTSPRPLLTDHSNAS